MSNGVQSIERALDLLEALADGGAMGISELGQTTGLPIATTHRLLTSLVARGYVRQDPTSRKYQLGAGLVRLGDAAGPVFRSWLHPYLAELVTISGETANLAVLEGGHVVYVAQAPSPRRVRMFTEVGNRVLPHSSAVGKVLLAFRPREVVLRLIAQHGLPARTARTITDPERFLAELDAVARQGYAVDDGEEEEGVRCVAVPLVGLGDPVAAMSVSGPAGRLARAQRERLVPRMQELAQRIATAWSDAS